VSWVSNVYYGVIGSVLNTSCFLQGRSVGSVLVPVDYKRVVGSVSCTGVYFRDVGSLRSLCLKQGASAVSRYL
jgi:hypothetical protein